MINFLDPYGILNINATRTIHDREWISFFNIKKGNPRKIRDYTSGLALDFAKVNDLLELIATDDQDPYEILYQKIQENECLRYST